jgi:hypothetical protein
MRSNIVTFNSSARINRRSSVDSPYIFDAVVAWRAVRGRTKIKRYVDRRLERRRDRARTKVGKARKGWGLLKGRPQMSW